MPAKKPKANLMSSFIKVPKSRKGVVLTVRSPAIGLWMYFCIFNLNNMSCEPRQYQCMHNKESCNSIVQQLSHIRQKWSAAACKWQKIKHIKSMIYVFDIHCCHVRIYSFTWWFYYFPLPNLSIKSTWLMIIHQKTSLCQYFISLSIVRPVKLFQPQS